MSSTQFIVSVITFAISIIIAVSYLDRSIYSGVVFSFYIAAFTWRSYTRNFCYVRQRPETALAGDLSLAASASITLVAVREVGEWEALQVAFIGLGAAYAGAMIVETSLLSLGTRLTLRWRSLRQYRRVWHQARWMLLGSTTSIVQSQAHSFVVTSTSGTAALAPLAAGQVPFAPMRIVTVALYQVLLPQIVTSIARNDRQSIVRMLGFSTLILGLGVIALGGSIALIWDFVFNHLYAGKYAENEIQWICAGWFLVVLFAATSFGPCAVLNALLHNRLLAIGTVYGSIISVVLALALIYLISPAWSLVGVMAGELFLLIYAVVHVRRELRAWRQTSVRPA
jgi:O-antigen/teichoic acid export membrane protein